MKKVSVTSHNLGSLPSPGAPSYRDKSVGSQKGWSSERVPLSSNRSRRNSSSASSFLLPFNSGKTLPSKWEDAERWICSPVSGNGMVKHSSSQPHKRPKSKSGPIVTPPGVVYYSNYSPAMQGFEGGSVRNMMVGSPLSAGVLAADSVVVHYGNSNGEQSYLMQSENTNWVQQSPSLPGWLELLSEPSLPSSQDEKLDETEEIVDSGAVSRRDMATQMSPECGFHSSPRGRSPFSPTHQPLPSNIVETEGDNSAKLEIRDVEVDKRATVIRWSKRRTSNVNKKGLPHVDDLNKNAEEAQASSWNIAESEMNISKLKREEAKITAWENLQKAKAEAAIRKLEMKLEKKKSSSMDKILNKLRVAQMKAQKMRSTVSVDEIPKTNHNVFSFKKYVQMGSFSGCFTSYAS
ncbi:hypothetical protein ACB094_02G162100 [Castanea mollissima]